MTNNRRNQVVPPGAGDEWVNAVGWLILKGYTVDLILRDMKRVEKIMKETEKDIVIANTRRAIHGYFNAMYRANRRS